MIQHLCWRKGLMQMMEFMIVFTLWLILSHSGCRDTRPSRTPYRVWVHHAAHKLIFMDATDIVGGTCSPTLTPHSLIKWEADPLLIQMFSSELKSALHSVRGLCLGTDSGHTDAYRAWGRLTAPEPTSSNTLGARCGLSSKFHIHWIKTEKESKTFLEMPKTWRTQRQHWIY